jgi:hypothetical protein
MERMDDRLWQTIEDAYAVDSGVSNTLNFPNVGLYAGSNTGTGVIFTSASAAFDSGNVGDIIRMSGGIAEVTAYTSGTSTTGNWILDANNSGLGIPYAGPGQWSISTPVSTLSAPNLAGRTDVVGLADGIVIAPTVDDTGLVTLPFAASNVKVGLPFTVQIQTPYLNGQEVIQGGRKAIPSVTVRLAGTATGFQVGRDQPDGGAQNPQQVGPLWSLLETADLTQPTGQQPPPQQYNAPSGGNVTQVYTGDFFITGGGASWESRGQIAIQQTQPVALEITMIAPNQLPGDEPEAARAERAPPQQRQAPESSNNPPPGWAAMRGRI